MNIGRSFSNFVLDGLFNLGPGRRRADFVIGSPGDIYIERWWLVPRNRFFNAYLHLIRRDDDDRALHDHPWWNMSILLDGCYREIVTGKPAVIRHAGDIVLRRASTQHRLELIHDRPCWSLFITGPRVRQWGFQCPRGWVPYRDFVDPDDPGKVGKGCPD